MSTLCVCGHAERWHDAHIISEPSTTGVCSIWSCYCTEYERAEQATLLEEAR